MASSGKTPPIASPSPAHDGEAALRGGLGHHGAINDATDEISAVVSIAIGRWLEGGKLFYREAAASSSMRTSCVTSHHICSLMCGVERRAHYGAGSAPHTAANRVLNCGVDCHWRECFNIQLCHRISHGILPSNTTCYPPSIYHRSPPPRRALALCRSSCRRTQN